MRRNKEPGRETQPGSFVFQNIISLNRLLRLLSLQLQVTGRAGAEQLDYAGERRAAGGSEGLCVGLLALSRRYIGAGTVAASGGHSPMSIG